MRISWELAACFAVGLALICLIGYLLLVPRRFMWRLLADGILGAAVLMIVNLIGAFFDFSVAVNPFTAMAVGFLGLPGAVLVILLQVSGFGCTMDEDYQMGGTHGKGGSGIIRRRRFRRNGAAFAARRL